MRLNPFDYINSHLMGLNEMKMILKFGKPKRLMVLMNVDGYL